MAEKKYLDANGLVRLVANIINSFAPKEHKHVMADIEDYNVETGDISPISNETIDAIIVKLDPLNFDELVEAVAEMLPRAEEVGF